MQTGYLLSVFVTVCSSHQLQQFIINMGLGGDQQHSNVIHSTHKLTWCRFPPPQSLSKSPQVNSSQALVQLQLRDAGTDIYLCTIQCPSKILISLDRQVVVNYEIMAHIDNTLVAVTITTIHYIQQGRSHWSGWSGFYPTTFLASSYVYIFITSESDRSGVTVRIGESYRLRDIGRRARGGVDTAPSVGTGTHLLRKCDTLRRWLPPTAPSYPRNHTSHSDFRSPSDLLGPRTL